MIHPRRLKGTATNVARYYTVGDYYTKGADEHSEWGGKIAVELGLEGRSTRRSSRIFWPVRSVISSLDGIARMGRSSIIRGGILLSTPRSRCRSWRWSPATTASWPPMRKRSVLRSAIRRL